MAVPHKCNKCFHQAYVKTTSSSRKFCLAINIEITDTVKNCSEFSDVNKMKEPDFFANDLDALVKNPTATDKRRITAIKKKIAKLRLWSEQCNKPKIRK